MPSKRLASHVDAEHRLRHVSDTVAEDLRWLLFHQSDIRREPIQQIFLVGQLHGPEPARPVLGLRKFLQPRHHVPKLLRRRFHDDLR